jgi:hypothetical protein
VFMGTAEVNDIRMHITKYRFTGNRNNQSLRAATVPQFHFVITLINIHCIKVMSSVCLIEHYAVKTYGGVEVELHIFLTSALDGDRCAVMLVGFNHISEQEIPNYCYRFHSCRTILTIINSYKPPG